MQIYCRQRGIPAPSPRDWAFFLALGLFRMAAILAGVGARARQGNASSARAAEVGSAATTCLQHSAPVGSGAFGHCCDHGRVLCLLLLLAALADHARMKDQDSRSPIHGSQQEPKPQ